MDNSRFTVMTEWLSDFEKDAMNEEEMKEWVYILIMYLWKGEVIETDNRFIRLAFNNMRNNADRMKAKKEEYQGAGRPSDLPVDRIYKLRKEGKKAKEIAQILNEEEVWGTITDKKVQNSVGWKKFTEDKKSGNIAKEIDKSEDKPTISTFNF